MFTFVHVWLAHIVDMLTGNRKLKENTEIVTRHEIHTVAVATQRQY